LRASRLSSLRLFWIFRNFADLHQHVLSPRQLQLILNCETLDNDARVNPEELLGTIELSSGPTKGFETKSLPRIKATQPIAHALMPRRSFAISAIATAAAVVFVAVAFSVAQAHWNGTLGNVGSKSKQIAKSLLPRMHGALRFTIVEPQQAEVQKPFSSNPEQVGSLPSPSPVWDKSELRSAVDVNASAPVTPSLQSAAFRYSSVEEPALATDIGAAVPHSSPRHSSISVHHSEIVPQMLPPAGPPETHPVLDDFSAVVRDTEVLLRAIVSPEGRVKEVKLLHGDATLGREAARIVRSWRYASRTGNTDGESRIKFRFTSDVTTVTFLDSGSPLQNR
jgi:Gram-negative bacterial TonB protein C-terminal